MTLRGYKERHFLSSDPTSFLKDCLSRETKAIRSALIMPCLRPFYKNKRHQQQLRVHGSFFPKGRQRRPLTPTENFPGL